MDKTINSPFVIKVKGTQGGIGYCRKETVCDYFKRYKDQVKLIEVEKKDNQIIFLGNKNIPFCTIRTAYGKMGNKKEYYQSKKGS